MKKLTENHPTKRKKAALWIAIRVLSWRCAPVHQAATAGSRPREQVRTQAGRWSAAPMAGMSNEQC